jgi:VIT1/CCC1 family predicted Fe2+/Mn2+ transporter
MSGDIIRPFVLSAHDGLVSIGSMLMGVTAAKVSSRDVLVVGLVSALAGALSMSLGEFSSVSAVQQHSPLRAAVVSFISFLLGSLIPITAAVVSPGLSGSLTGIALAVIVGLVLVDILIHRYSVTSSGRGYRWYSMKATAGGAAALAASYLAGMYVEQFM